jgi:hypothetical protein
MKQSTQQLSIKPRQKQILFLLYKFRFLNRKHIQNLLDHQHHRAIQDWLNELTNQKYIKQYYDRSMQLPAIYSLDNKGRKYLKTKPSVKPKILDRVWREAKYSPIFQNHCLFIGDIYLSLLSLTKTNATLHFFTKTDLYSIAHLIKPSPDAYFAIKGKDNTIKRYFLDIFDDNLPPTALRLRVRKYFNYIASDEWQDNTDKPFPEIILVCPTTRLKNHLFYYIQRKLEEEPSLNFYLTTKEDIIKKGLTRHTLEKIKVKD